MSRVRGVALQLALARYLAQWWPAAESAGSGRNGTDITGTPGVVWECKTAREFRPLEWCRQASGHGMTGDIPVTVYIPNGIGEKGIGQAIAMMPLREMISLLRSTT
jgi:hypothetical protein